MTSPWWSALLAGTCAVGAAACEPAAPSPPEDVPIAVARVASAPERAVDYPIVYSAAHSPDFRPALFMLAADGHAIRQFALPLPSDGPAWSPDGCTIAYRQRGSELAASPSEPSTLALSSLAGGESVALLTDDDPESDLVRTGIPDAPSFSPDGQSLAFASRRGGDWSLWTVSRNGSLLRELLPGFAGPQYSPSWSPATPDEIAFVAISDGRQDLWRVNISRPESAENLTRAIPRERLYSPRSPRWSSAGTALAFVADDGTPPEEGGGDSEVYVLDLATRELVQVTDNTDVDASPTWSPDGRQLLIASNRLLAEGYAPDSVPYRYLNLWRVALDGSEEPLRLTFDQGTNVQADWFRGAGCAGDP